MFLTPEPDTVPRKPNFPTPFSNPSNLYPMICPSMPRAEKQLKLPVPDGFPLQDHVKDGLTVVSVRSRSK